jgi:hypothetical protein
MQWCATADQDYQELKEGNPRVSVYGLMVDQLGKGQRLKGTDEARIHLRDSPGNDFDIAVQNKIEIFDSFRSKG